MFGIAKRDISLSRIGEKIEEGLHYLCLTDDGDLLLF